MILTTIIKSFVNTILKSVQTKRKVYAYNIFKYNLL